MDNTNEKGIFYAFISHKSADSAFALKLQKFIESYRLPAEIRKKTKAPKYLSPVCSYEIDFSSNPLLEEMDDKINRSNFLILLCSEALIKNDPKYVNYEINTFIECKRKQGIEPAKRIIPVIIDGEFDSPDNECCPEALKAMGDNRPIGIDIRKYKNERDAFLHILSGLLDIDYAVLVKRDAKYRKRRKIIAIASALVVLAVSAFMCDYFIPKKLHYLDFAMKDGIPVGIEKLSKSQYSKINHYVITRQKYKTTSLEYVNSKGKLINHNNIIASDRPAKYEFNYDSRGLTKVTFCNSNGIPYFVQQYSDNKLMAADLKNPSDMTKAHFIGAGYENEPSVLLSDYNIVSHSNVSRFQYKYTDGYVSGVTFHRDNSGAMAEDSSVYGFEYSLDSKGRVVETYYIDALGERRLNSEGIFCKQFSYDKNNNLVQLKNLNSNGELVADKNGIYQIVRAANDKHQIVSVKFLDANGELMFSENYGYALKIFDPEDNIVMLYGADNNLISDKDYCGAKLTYDKNGFEQSQTYLDKDKNPVVDSESGYATVYRENDKKGNAISVSYLDEKGNPVNNKSGYAKVENVYNDRGLEIEKAYYDKDGNKVDYQGYGYSVKKTTYDEFGRELSTAYFDAENQPVEILGPSFSYGYHETKTTYHDGASVKMTVEYYDKDKNLVNCKSKALGEEYAQAVFFMQNGIITSVTYYDKDGNIWGEIIENSVDYSPTAEKIETMKTYSPDKKLISKNVHTYNLKGVNVKTERTEYGEKEQVTELMTTIYDDAGRRTKTELIRYTQAGEVTSEFYQEFDKDEKEIRSILITPGEEDFYKTEHEYTYHKNGEVKSEKSVIINTEGIIQSQYIEMFGADKIKTNDVRELYEDGHLRYKVETKYHSNGEWSEVRKTTFADDGTEKTGNVSTYDENGKELTFQLVTYNNGVKTVGDVTNNPDGSRTQTVTVYNADGTVKSSDTREYDKDRNAA